MTTAVLTPDLKRQRRGWYAYGWASHTFPTTVTTVFMSRYLPSTAEEAVGVNGRLHILGIPIAPGSLFTYTVSAVSILLVFVMPVVGAIADRTGYRRQLVLGFGFAGALCCAAMWFVGKADWGLGTILYAGAYLCYSCAFIVYNSILPLIAGPDSRDRVSSIGWAGGYIGGGILLTSNLVLSFFVDKVTLARVSLSSAGLWWAVFMIVPLVLMRNLPKSAVARVPVSGSVLTAGFRQLGRTLRGLRKYPLTLFFLLAFLIYNDGINTVTTISADYGEKELLLNDNTLLEAILMVQFVAFGGALLLSRLADRWGAKRVVLGSLVVWTGVVLSAYVIKPGIPWQFFLVAFVLALVMGGSQALSRSLFSSMIPAGNEAEYFSLYEISNSGTSALGPLLFGLAYQNTGSYRTALVSLLVFFIVGGAMLAKVNARKAIVLAGNTPPATLVTRVA